jgi:arabinogalactan endo-1,4-beta-galactosidase
MLRVLVPRFSTDTCLLLLLMLLLIPACSEANEKTPREFLTGADISSLLYYEKKGIKYFENGEETSFLDIAKRNGWKILRVRVWVDPEATPQFQVSNLQNVTLLAKRIKAAGFKLLLDFHYSDSWADPGEQKKPAAWNDLPFDELVQRVHDYSRDVVKHLRENDATPDIVQVGNEIRNGLLFGSGWDRSGPIAGGGFWENDKGGAVRAVRLFAAGRQGVLAASPENAPPLIMLHIPDGQETSFVNWYFPFLEAQAQKATPPEKFEYDIIGLSYYPADPWDRKGGYEPWHMKHLVDSMNSIAATLRKPFMVVETNWPRTGEPQAIPGAPEFPFTPEGQAQYYRALVGAVCAVPHSLGLGVLVWEPEDTLAWKSVFDDRGNALPAVRVLGQKQGDGCT